MGEPSTLRPLLAPPAGDDADSPINPLQSTAEEPTGTAWGPGQGAGLDDQLKTRQGSGEIDPLGTTNHEIPVQNPSQDEWAWRDEHADERPPEAPPIARDAILPTVILGIALVGIIAWFMFGR